MRKKNKDTEVFLELVRAGLWEKEVRLASYGEIDFAEIYRLAKEQAVIGLAAAGLEHAADKKAQKKDVLQFIGQTLQLEQRNQAMNYFIGVIVYKMRQAGIYTLLVKGQGIAQCYERPLWRSCGDVDFYLSEDNYEKAKEFLIPLASHVDEEDQSRHHLGMTIEPWVVELHGTLHSDFSDRMDRGLDEIHQSIFYSGEVRSWNNDGLTVFLPSVDNDILIVFTHILQHFYVGGIGLRQICDWCRLMFKYKGEINLRLLSDRLKRMGLMGEWKSFAALVVDYLGLPEEAMPLYEKTGRNSRRASKIMRLVVDAGNFGHNNDESYRTKYPYPVHKAMTFWRRLGEFAQLFAICPMNTLKFFFTYVFRRTKASIKVHGYDDRLKDT